MHAGDHIGMENCIDLDTDNNIYTALFSGDGADRKPWRLNNNNRKSSMSAKEFPPPLPVQTTTVLKRYYTDDGRLIIAEEKIDSPKCHFTAVRSNGRLTLQLVRSESSSDAEIGREETVIIEEERGGKLTVDSDGNGDGDGVGKCFNYKGAVKVAATGPCLLVEQNQLHAMRPVKI